MSESPFGSSAQARIRSLVAERTRPLLLVGSTPGADALARKGGLTVADLVRPFCVLRNASIPFRTPGGVLTLREFAMRVVPVGEFTPTAPEFADAALSRVVTSVSSVTPGHSATASGVVEASLASAEDVAFFVSRTRGDFAPWFSAWRQESSRALRALPVEASDAPVGVLVVTSTLDSDPVAAAREATAIAMRALGGIGGEQYDTSSTSTFFLLLNDAAARTGSPFSHVIPGATPDAPPFYKSPLDGALMGLLAPSLERARATFGANICFAATVNSAAPGDAPRPDIWSSLMQEPLFSRPAGLPPLAQSVSEALLKCAVSSDGNASGVRGSSLSESDVRELTNALSVLLKDSLLPALEARMFALHGLVQKARSGRFGKMLSGWLGSSAPETSRPRGLASVGLAVAGQALAVGSNLLGAAISGSAESSAPNSPTPANSANSSDVLSPMSSVGSVEHAIRTLGDFSLAVGDYENAIAMFRAAREDIRADRFPAHAASAAESLAISLFLSSGPSRDVDSLFEAAVIGYTRAASIAPPDRSQAAGASPAAFTGDVGFSAAGAPSPAQAAAWSRRTASRLAARAGALGADVLLLTALGSIPPNTHTNAAAAATAANAVLFAGISGSSESSQSSKSGALATMVTLCNARLREGATLLRRAASVEGTGTLSGALLTENAAYLLLLQCPPASRRAAHALSDAGQAFANVGASRHAARCLSLASSAYGSAWPTAGDHLSLHLSGRLSVINDAPAACALLSRVLSSSHVSRVALSTQVAAIKELAKCSAQWAMERREDAAKRAAAAVAAGRSPPAAGAPPERAVALAAGAFLSLDTRSLSVVSWPNASLAALATAQVVASLTPSNTPVLISGPSEIAFSGASVSVQVIAAARALVEAGSADGALANEGVWASGGEAEPSYARQLDALSRDARACEKLGSFAFYSTAHGNEEVVTPVSTPRAVASAATAGPSTAPLPPWKSLCADLALVAVDEAEATARAKSVAPAAVVVSATSADEFAPSAPTGPAASRLGHRPAHKSGARAVTADVLSRIVDRYVGEPFGVVVSLHNPLGIELNLRRLRLVGEIADAAVAAGAADLSGSAAWPRDASSAQESDTPGLDVLPIDLTLAPGERRHVYLAARPLCEGALKITSIAWGFDIPGSVPLPARADFSLPGIPLNDSRANKTTGARCMDRRLEARVRAPREWASVKLIFESTGTQQPSASTAAWSTRAPQLPPPAPPALPVFVPIAMPLALLDGEVRSGWLELFNAGTGPIGTVRVRATGHGRLQLVPESGTLDGLDGSTFELNVSNAERSTESGEWSTVGPKNVVGAGEKVRWRVVLRATRAGSANLNVLVAYGPPREKPSPSISGLRVLRWTARALVAPSLHVSASLAPAPGAPAGDFALSLSLSHVAYANSAAPPPIAIEGVQLVSGGWRAVTTGKTIAGIDGAPPVAEVLGGKSADEWGRPLAFGESHTLRFELVPLVPTPTDLLLPDGTTRALAPEDLPSSPPAPAAAAGTEPSRSTLPYRPAPGTPEDIDALVTTTLLRQSMAAVSVSDAIRAAFATENARRRAAEAVDALPPTLKSIREGKLAAADATRSDASGGGGGVLAREYAPPHALVSLTAARSLVSIVISWRVVSAEAPARGHFSLLNLRVGADSAVANLGVPPSWIGRSAGGGRLPAIPGRPPAAPGLPFARGVNVTLARAPPANAAPPGNTRRNSGDGGRVAGPPDAPPASFPQQLAPPPTPAAQCAPLLVSLELGGGVLPRVALGEHVAGVLVFYNASGGSRVSFELLVGVPPADSSAAPSFIGAAASAAVIIAPSGAIARQTLKLDAGRRLLVPLAFAAVRTGSADAAALVFLRLEGANEWLRAVSFSHVVRIV